VELRSASPAETEAVAAGLARELGAGLSAAEWGDLEPYFEDAICFVEWPEAAAGSLPPVRVAVRLSHVDPMHRLIALESSEEALLDRLFGGADSRL